jgi:hypothetical protein
VLGIGAASLATGAIIGGLALRQRKDIESRCDGTVCPASLSDDRDEVKNMSLAADILMGIGAAAVVAGVVLFFVEPKRKTDRAELTVQPSADGLALSVSRSF